MTAHCTTSTAAKEIKTNWPFNKENCANSKSRHDYMKAKLFALKAKILISILLCRWQCLAVKSLHICNMQSMQNYNHGVLG